MASLICFGIRPLPSMLVGFPFPSPTITRRRTKTQFSLIHTFQLLTYDKHNSPNHVFRTQIFASDMSSMPSRKEDKDKRFGRCATGASFVLACVLGVIVGGGLRKRPTAIAGPMDLEVALVVENPLSGKYALKSLLDVVALTSSKIEAKPPSVDFQFPSRLSTKDVNDIIKVRAVKIMRCGKAEDAVKFLQNAYAFYRNSGSETAYFVEMALVEILISLGKYKEALERNCMKNVPTLPADGRFPLYKAIIYTMLDNKGEAKKWWRKYGEAIEGGLDSQEILENLVSEIKK